MRSLLRSWRVWWLALALVAAPQLSFVHALSHLSPAGIAQADDDRLPAPEKACDTCLSLAQLGHALTSTHAWAGVSLSPAVPHVAEATHAELRAPAYFQARAPPAFL